MNRLPRLTLVVLIFFLVPVVPAIGEGVGGNLIPNPGIDGLDRAEGRPPSWSHWAPAENISPAFSFDPGVGCHKAGSLKAQALGKPYTMGRWQSRISGIAPDKTYRFELSVKPENLPDPGRAILIALHWFDSNDKLLATDYVPVKGPGDDWVRCGRTVEAPSTAVSVTVEIYLRGRGLGIAWFDDFYLAETEPIAHRKVRVGTIWVKPWSDGTPEGNIERFVGWIEKAGEAGCDIVCLPEAMTGFCVPRDKQALSPIPGPVTDRLGEIARKHRMHLIACFNELLDGKGYNTAVWIGRDGAVGGKYHKTHLPFTEFVQGLVPGDEYPAFETDFGTIGMEICYDNFFPEVARSLRLNGAEIIFLPIWGDERAGGNIWDIMARARAIDNGVYLVACKYGGGRSLIVDPEGNILADTNGIEGLITADLDLDKRFLTPYLSAGGLGEWRALFMPERRPETYGPITTPF